MTITDTILDYQAGLNNLQDLEYLCISKTDLRGEILSLRKLRYLSISNAKTIPVNLSDLKNLVYLSLHNMDILELPCEINTLKSLKYLNLFNCRINSIAHLDLDKMKKLKYISLLETEVSSEGFEDMLTEPEEYSFNLKRFKNLQFS